MQSILSRYAKNLLNIIYPLHCLVCRTPLDAFNEDNLCRACLRNIKVNPLPHCPRCGRSVRRVRRVCSECEKSDFSFDTARSSCLYQDTLRECIHLLKYRKKLCLARPLSRYMAAFLRNNREFLAPVDAIVPVPLAPYKLRERSYNQSKALAAPLAKEFGIPLLDALVKIKPTVPQSDLHKNERKTNLAGVFRVRDPLAVRARTLLIIDDVMTTGSTADECSRALLNAGASGVRLLTLARGL
ncbi:MAG: ComF family protein [Candidatus Omnitrophota bacterium]